MYPPDKIVIRRFRDEELNQAIIEAQQRGYSLITRGKHRDEYIKSSKITYWAKLEKVQM